MNKGWWRRNLWGLVLVVPLVAGLLAFEAEGAYRANYSILPREPVPVDVTGRAVLDDYGVRIIQVVPVTAEKEIEKVIGFGKTKPPASVKIWRAVLAVDGRPLDEENNLLGGCDTALEDAQGRRYEHAPSELGGDSTSFQQCRQDDEDQPMPYTTTLYYLLPADARPTKLIITWSLKLPRFIELPVP